MKIDDQFNLVIPIADPVRAFSAPISEAVFEASYRVLSAANEQIFGRGMKPALLTGPRTAAIAIVDAGKRLAVDDGVEGDLGASAFRSEIKRLTTILAPGSHGFDMMPVEQAVQSGVIDEGDWRDVEGLLCFFMLAWLFETRRARNDLVKWLAETLSCSVISQNLEDYAASLMISKPDAQKNKIAASSVPI